MDVKDWIQIIAIIITLFVSIITLGFSAGTAKKTRRANIVSVRRKERMEKFILCYSKITAICYFKTLINLTAETFYREIIELQNDFIMSLSLNFEKDVVLSDIIKDMVGDAIYLFEYLKSDNIEDNVIEEYNNDFLHRKNNLEMLLNVYLSTEWGRIQIESESGKKVKFEDWLKLYNSNVDYYKKWNDI